MPDELFVSMRRLRQPVLDTGELEQRRARIPVQLLLAEGEANLRNQYAEVRDLPPIRGKRLRRSRIPHPRRVPDRHELKCHPPLPPLGPALDRRDEQVMALRGQDERALLGRRARGRPDSGGLGISSGLFARAVLRSHVPADAIPGSPVNTCRPREPWRTGELSITREDRRENRQSPMSRSLHGRFRRDRPPSKAFGVFSSPLSRQRISGPINQLGRAPRGRPPYPVVEGSEAIFE